MVIETVAAAAIAILSPYLAKAAGSFAEKAGEQLAEKAGSLYQFIKKQFTDDASAETKLALLEKEPESNALMSVLEEELVKKMNADANFAATLNRLVEEAKGADSNKVLVFGDRSIGVGGDVSGSTFITGDSNTVGKP
jgi:hypothetical protein